EPQIFEEDGVVGLEQLQRGFVVEVRALALEGLMYSLKIPLRFAALPAPLLAPAHPLVGFGQLLLTTPMQARILHSLAISGDEEHLPAQVNACLAASGWQRARGPISARDIGIPPIRVFANRDGLGLPSSGRLQCTATRPSLESTR